MIIVPQRILSARVAAAVLAACIFNVHGQSVNLAKDLNESVASLNVSVKDFYGREVNGKVVVTQYKPNGDGPFPIAILNHGRGPDRAAVARFRFTQPARYFVKRGFAVFAPTRIGYGEAGTQPDPEDSGICKQKNFASMAQVASTQILAVLEYAKQQTYADPARVLLVGQSVGGYSTVASAARNPPGLLAAINFAGGSGGDPVGHPGEPCQSNKMEEMYAGFGTSAKVPMLWVYTENDQYFSPKHSQAWHGAYVNAGGKADFKLFPPFGKDGHKLFSAGVTTWEPVVSEFLDSHGFPAAPH